MRLIRIEWSASTESLPWQRAGPSGMRPISTTSIVARTSTPIASADDAIASQDVPLALHSCATVAAHGGHDVGLHARCLQVIHRGAHNFRQVGNAPAARAHGHRVARLHLCHDAALAQLLAHLGVDVMHAGGVKGLVHSQQFVRQGCGEVEFLDFVENVLHECSSTFHLCYGKHNNSE
jgi:hypothetical protein